ncbi:MAG: dihydrolipoamide succinyltransferase [Methylococcaceae bacterium TMED69]|nr:MAG: dihydrolipoamide succinyltransferase [Methylococcaceae bacterium TMED69]
MIIEVKVPALAESVPDATCLEWYKAEGDTIGEGESLIDLETDKVTLEITAPAGGMIKSILKNAGDIVLTDDVLVTIDTSVVVDIENRSIAETEKKSAPPSKSTSIKSGPAVSRLIEEKNLKIDQITGTGRGSRVTKGDVISYLKNEKGSSQDKSSTSSDRKTERVPMTRLRERVAEKLVSSQQEGALLTTFNEIDMSEIIKMRKDYQDDFIKKHGIKLGFMSIFVKATVQALKEYPVINASVEGKDILYHNFYDIGVAVGGGKGLVVPIIRNADELSFAQVESKIKMYGEKALENKLSVDELTGGTFTISNGGIYGSLLSTPIVNSPQSAILGMHKISEKPVVKNGEIDIAPMMYVALSYDHRIIDGREAVQFLDKIRRIIEKPLLGLLDI